MTVQYVIKNGWYDLTTKGRVSLLLLVNSHLPKTSRVSWWVPGRHGPSNEDHSLPPSCLWCSWIQGWFRSTFFLQMCSLSRQPLEFLLRTSASRNLEKQNSSGWGRLKPHITATRSCVGSNLEWHPTSYTNNVSRRNWSEVSHLQSDSAAKACMLVLLPRFCQLVSSYKQHLAWKNRLCCCYTNEEIPGRVVLGHQLPDLHGLWHQSRL